MITLTEEERVKLTYPEYMILQRERKATLGPWLSTPLSTYTIIYRPEGAFGDGVGDLLCGDNKDADANFMAHARVDVPYLRAEVIRLRLELAEADR